MWLDAGPRKNHTSRHFDRSGVEKCPISPPSGSGQAPSARPAACTIISRNYLSHAKVLADSYLKQAPEGRFYLLVVDDMPEHVDLDLRVCKVSLADLEVENVFDLCFKYNVTELCTAVKPSFLRLVFDRFLEDQVIYFDPDILIFDQLRTLSAALDHADIVLTPHLLKPIPQDGRRPSEQDILIAGAYNLGFIALRQSDQVQSLLEWWEERLRDQCRIDPARGLMTDQRWVDLVPGLFPSTTLLRDDTYNVAYWNLHERAITRLLEQFFVNGRPLNFFHFSGFDPARPSVLSKHQDRTELIEGSALFDLFQLYAVLQYGSGYESFSKLGYGFSEFDNGIAVHPLLRQLYLDLEPRARAVRQPVQGRKSSVLPRLGNPSRRRMLEQVHLEHLPPAVRRGSRLPRRLRPRPRGLLELGQHPGRDRDGLRAEAGRPGGRRSLGNRPLRLPRA